MPTDALKQKNWKYPRAGGTRKVRDLDTSAVCTDPSHNPPSMMVFEEGHYEHTCPRCGRITHFTVVKPRW